MGGAKRCREPDESDAYGWWMLGLDSMESGMSEMFHGMRHQRRAIRILAEKEKGAGRLDDE